MEDYGKSVLFEGFRSGHSMVLALEARIRLGNKGRQMSKSALEIFRTWMQSYLRGIVHNNKVNSEAMVWIQNFTRSVFDLINIAMVVGVLRYLARKGQSTLLKVISETASMLLIIYCITYVGSWRLRLFHPVANRRVGALLDIAVGVGISVALLVGVSVAVESSIHEIARLEGK